MTHDWQCDGRKAALSDCLKASQAEDVHCADASLGFGFAIRMVQEAGLAAAPCDMDYRTMRELAFDEQLTADSCSEA